LGRPQAATDYFGELAELGVDQAIFSMPNVYDLEPFDLMATEIVPVVSKITPPDANPNSEAARACAASRFTSAHPGAKHLKQPLPGLTRDRFLGEHAHQTDGPAHLGKVVGAIAAPRQMPFNALPLSVRKRALKILRHQSRQFAAMQRWYGCHSAAYSS
jgi:hypothetical protein